MIQISNCLCKNKWKEEKLKTKNEMKNKLGIEQSIFQTYHEPTEPLNPNRIAARLQKILCKFLILNLTHLNSKKGWNFRVSIVFLINFLSFHIRMEEKNPPEYKTIGSIIQIKMPPLSACTIKKPTVE